MGRTCCVQKLFLPFRTIFEHNIFFPCSVKGRASDKDLPVQWPCTTTLSSPGVCITLDKAFQVPFHGHNVPRSSTRLLKHSNTRKNVVLPVQLNFFGTEKRLILQQISQSHHPSISPWHFVCYWLGFW